MNYRLSYRRNFHTLLDPITIGLMMEMKGRITGSGSDRDVREIYFTSEYGLDTVKSFLEEAISLPFTVEIDPFVEQE